MTITLYIPEGIKINPIVTEAEFEKIALENQDLRLERTHTGKLIIMPPTGSNTGRKNSDLIAQLVIWNKNFKLGIVFDSSTGFRLPKGSTRSPDVSWVEKSRWDSLTEEEQDGYAPICPDFAVELRSPTDNLKTLQNKMLEYLDNGLLLGWLIDPISKKIEIYRKDQDKEILNNPTTISGDPVLPDFILNLSQIL